MRVLSVLRAARFSPNSVERDRAIMTAVCDRLRRKGHEVSLVSEDDALPTTPAAADGVLTMGRLPGTLEWLSALPAGRVLNAPDGVRHCNRCEVDRLLRQYRLLPTDTGTAGYWLKRGDSAAQEPGDVVYAADRKALQAAQAEFQRRGIGQFTVSPHVVGDLVKFYGVLGTGFFSYCYPTDDGLSKFGDEHHNGAAHHYAFDASSLCRSAERLAEAVGVAIYGGDCIVRADGSFCIIDFNDWPSFSRCREEAADAIVRLALGLWREDNDH